MIFDYISTLPLPAHEDESPAREIVQRTLRVPAPAGWTPTGIDRSMYLDVMERIVRAAAGWQDAQGAIIDPVANIECGQTSPRFAAPGSILLSFGRVPELQESVCRTMRYACRRLADGEANSPDFWMRELMTAYFCLAPLVEPALRAEWEADLRRVNPERVYSSVEKPDRPIASLHNWTIYAVAGEWMREVAGLYSADAGICGRAFVEKYLPPQLNYFSPEGLYRDPGDPMTYDFTTRLQLATALAFGYHGPASEAVNAHLCRAGYATLLYVSPDGYAPYGGRSATVNFQEAIITALCELEACRHRDSDPRLASAYKRQAHRSALAVRRWLLEMEPFRHMKNGFDPAASFGRDVYGHYSVYSLLAASFFGLAALFADDDIPEAPCPAEVGGYVFVLPDAFHKVFATCGHTHVEMDLRADAHYDATGLGRFTRAGVPLELGPGTPITATPSFLLPSELVAAHPLATGPAWPHGDGWQSLAALSDGLQARYTVDHATPDETAFSVTYTWQDDEITEAYTLSEGRVRIRATILHDAQPMPRLRFQVPLLVTDGDTDATVTESSGQLTVTYRHATLTIRYAAEFQVEVTPETVANRNGIYRCLVLETAGNTIEVELSLVSE